MKKMKAIMRFKSSAIVTILLFCIYGCGQDASTVDDSTIPLRIEFRLAPDAPAQSSITAIELTVSAPDMDDPLIFQITDINQEQRSAREFITLPAVDNMTFSVVAFEGDCRMFSGLRENVSPVEGDSVEISLAPIPIVIGIRVEQEQLSVGTPCRLEVYIEDAPPLFALTCELEFDPSVLQPQEVAPGSFFGADVLFIEDSEFQRREENRLALGITRKADAAAGGAASGACGSGVVFEVTFETIGTTGNTAITLQDNITLTTPDFDQIDVPSRVIIEAGAFVEIQ